MNNLGLILRAPQNQEVIFPYIGGSEINTSPTHAPHRYIIDVGERGEMKCRARWPELMAILENKVKPVRLRASRKSKSGYGQRVSIWWQHYHHAKELYATISGLERVLTISRISNAFAFTFLPAGMVYNEKTIIFPWEKTAPFVVLQSRIHEVWARFFSSTLKDDLQYTPSACFETFPFPIDWEVLPDLDAVGKEYYEFRAALMVKCNQGMTKTYNRFHDPYENAPGIARLRDLHAAIDCAVLDAYGWTDIPTDCDFLLDYEIDEATWGRKKKPYRYRWPNPVRNEVLARLLTLNAERAAEEARAGAIAQKSKPKPAQARYRRRSVHTTKVAEAKPLWDPTPDN